MWGDDSSSGVGEHRLRQEAAAAVAGSNGGVIRTTGTTAAWRGVDQQLMGASADSSSMAGSGRGQRLFLVLRRLLAQREDR
jgi:hypothetical protein